MVLPHWTSEDWARNLAFDPSRPDAFPAEGAMDLMGRIRVRLRAEGGNLVAYGFDDQRIEISRSSVGAVLTVNAYRMGAINRGAALLVLDHEDRILLRAPGLWETHGEVREVCRATGLPKPRHEYFSPRSRSRARSTGAGRRARNGLPLFRKAPGYRRLHTVPRGNTVRVLARLVLALALIGLTAFIGVIPALALPGWFGAVRTLIGIAGVAIGGFAGAWLYAAIANALADGLHWALASLRARGLAPAGRFFSRREPSGKWSSAVTALMVLGVPALIYWGPGMAIASGAHGVSDSHLVGTLRAQGVPAPGFLVDVPDYETDDHGNTTVTDVPTLSFRFDGQDWQVTDPSIRGRPLPLDDADPEGTRQPLTVVYLPGDPDTAAASQQLAGSVWHGAPTANVISGGVLTAALPLLLWRTIRRVRRRRWLRNADLLNDIAPARVALFGRRPGPGDRENAGAGLPAGGAGRLPGVP
jgi:hypothetical protein